MDLRETPPRPFVRHPWETARLRFFTHVLANHHLLQQSLRVLDVGAGDAWFSAQLLDRLPAGASITCWDSGYGHEAPVPESDPRLAFSRDAPPGPFQLALLLDVLEHVPDDAAFLETVLSGVAGSGAVLFSVPAWQRLMSGHDTAVAHHRRYDPAAARRLLLGAGLRIVRSGGLFHALLLPRAAAVVVERLLRPTREQTPTLEWKRGTALRRLVEAALVADNAVSAAAARYGLTLPGLSWWALCRKP